MGNGEARRPRAHSGQVAPRLEDNLDALPTAAVLIDLDDRVLSWNAPAAVLLGIAAEDAVGRLFRDLPASYAIPKLRAALEEAKRQPRPSTLANVTFRRGDGSLATARVSVAPVVEPPNRMMALLVTLEDLTDLMSLTAERDELERRLAGLGARNETTEMQLLDAASELRSANEELTVLNEELQDRIAELEAAQAADRQKTEFLAILSHELRNPLAAVMNAAHVIRRQAPRDPVIGRASHAVERQVGHLARLLEDLLDVARIQQGKLELRREPVDLAVAVAEAVEANRHLIQSGRHRLSVAVPERELTVAADPIRLVQVFGNLLNNAAKYTDAGGEISVMGQLQDGEAVVHIRDSGLGIAPELLPKIFTLFTQADSSLVRSRGGLGVGLTLVRQLVELHGGRVTARSEGIGLGSEFTVHLPLIQAAAVSEPRPESMSPLPQRRLRILVVEDSRDAREMLRLALQLEGHDVSVAMDGPQGVEEARAVAPDVVLVDIGLPGLDGYEVARQIRSSLGAGVVLVALTGYGDSESRRLAVEAGFDHHLVKPVDPLELLRRLETGGGGGGRSLWRPA
jgi:PAS domain S-box-containing protein